MTRIAMPPRISAYSAMVWPSSRSRRFATKFWTRTTSAVMGEPSLVVEGGTPPRACCLITFPPCGRPTDRAGSGPVQVLPEGLDEARPASNASGGRRAPQGNRERCTRPSSVGHGSDGCAGGLPELGPAWNTDHVDLALRSMRLGGSATLTAGLSSVRASVTTVTPRARAVCHGAPLYVPGTTRTRAVRARSRRSAAVRAPGAPRAARRSVATRSARARERRRRRGPGFGAARRARAPRRRPRASPPVASGRRRAQIDEQRVCRVREPVEGVAEVAEQPQVVPDARERQEQEERGRREHDRDQGGPRPANGDEPEQHRPEEELQREREAQRGPCRCNPVSVTPRDCHEEYERERHVPGLVGVDHRRPEQRDSVNPPVAHLEDPERGDERRDHEQRHHPVGGTGRERRQRDGRQHRRHGPDRVRPVGEVRIGRRIRVAAVHHGLRLRVELLVEVEREPVLAGEGREAQSRGRRVERRPAP